jgi:eukaryotic-like serine/threonine-protein kinase
LISCLTPRAEIANYNRRVRNLMRYFLLALLLLAVALISAITTMRLAIHVREVRVPDFRGKTPAQARLLAEQNGLAIEVQSSYYSATVPEGRVLSQGPGPGVLVRRGWDVQVALSLGPQRVSIPEVVGESDRAAAISIAERGLQLSSRDEVTIAGVAAGQVIAQNPSAHATDASAPKISLLVAQEPPPQAFVMPSFIGESLGAVSVTLRQAGLSLGKIAVAVPPPTPAATSAAATPPPAVAPLIEVQPPPVYSTQSIVLAQDPAPGHKVLAGAAINLVVK